MGLFSFLTKPIRDMFIVRPPEAMELLVYRYPDHSIPYGAKVTVRSDEQALFFREGHLVGVLNPGTHQLETNHLPFLGDLIVSPLSGDRHVTTELFFVRTSEQLVPLGPLPLGTYKDLGSGHLVSFLASCRVNVRIDDAAQVVTQLGGVRASSGVRIEDVMKDRICSLIAAAVGELTSVVQALDVTSNRYSEQIGQAALRMAEHGFEGTGARPVRFLNLQISLDSQSERALRDFGAAQARLSIEREGAEVASTPGFAAYHAAHGNRAMLEGIGSGVAKGNNGAMFMHLGLGASMLTPSVGLGSGVPSASSSGVRPAARLARAPMETRYELRTPRGIEGPFVERQLVLRARIVNFDPRQTYIRCVGETGWTPLSEHPIGQQVQQQAAALPLASGSPAGATDRFDQAMELAAADGVLAPAELTLLSRIALDAGLAPNPTAAQEYVLIRARALGLSLP